MKRTIIAEIASNHCGDMNLAKCLIYEAKLQGADIAKFQLFDSKALYGEYKDYELTKEQTFELADYCKQVDIEFLSSVFDLERIKWCEEIGVKRYKIATRSNQNKELIEAICETGKPVIISSAPFKTPYKWDFLYCIPLYPTPLEKLALDSVDFSRDYDGFSDHTLGIMASQVALSRGACIIEKHFKLDNNPPNPDYSCSITPKELRQLVEFARAVEVCCTSTDYRSSMTAATVPNEI